MHQSDTMVIKRPQAIHSCHIICDGLKEFEFGKNTSLKGMKNSPHRCVINFCCFDTQGLALLMYLDNGDTMCALASVYALLDGVTVFFRDLVKAHMPKAPRLLLMIGQHALSLCKSGQDCENVTMLREPDGLA